MRKKKMIDRIEYLISFWGLMATSMLLVLAAYHWDYPWAMIPMGVSVIAWFAGMISWLKWREARR